jgi:hypothetical protein
LFTGWGSASAYAWLPQPVNNAAAARLTILVEVQFWVRLRYEHENPLA